MDLFKTIVSEFLLDLRMQKLRAFLTMFGIVWAHGFPIRTSSPPHRYRE